MISFKTYSKKKNILDGRKAKRGYKNRGKKNGKPTTMPPL